VDASSLNGLLSTPLVLSASIAGALAALFIVLALIKLRRAGGASISRLLLPLALIVTLALTVTALLDRMALNERGAERRALLQRNADLTASVLTPGSKLVCLDGGAGETVENACEKAVFANAQSVAAAIAFTAARISLLGDAAGFAQRHEPEFLDAFAAIRRALELDRYGLAAHVLAERDGCTAEHCAAFALLRDTGVLVANLRAHAFDTYVARYATAWNNSEPESEAVAERQPPALRTAVDAGAPQPADAPKNPVMSHYDFPSAASIPPVSIMNTEPRLPKAAEAPIAAADVGPVPMPPKRPQVQATTPSTR